MRVGESAADAMRATTGRIKQQSERQRKVSGMSAVSLGRVLAMGRKSGITPR
jgi:hypothetical protein